MIAGRALLLALAAAIAIVPAVAGEHVFSHRYYFSGRVVDAAGAPVAGLEVNATIPGLPAFLCAGTSPGVTDPLGDYSVCLHAHVVPFDGTGLVTIANESHVVPLNATTRRTSFFHELPTEAPGRNDSAWDAFNLTYRVTGRVVNATAPATVEGVDVPGTIRANEPVAVVISYNGGALAKSAVATTDQFGDFVADLALDARPTDGWVVATGAARVERALLNATFLRSDLHLVYDRNTPVVTGPPVHPFQREDMPGSTATPGVPLPLAVVGVLFAAFALARASRGD